MGERRIYSTDRHAPPPLFSFENMLTAKETAYLLGVTAEWLSASRRGIYDGPAWYRFGPKSIRYRREDVEMFLKSKMCR